MKVEDAPIVEDFESQVLVKNESTINNDAADHMKQGTFFGGVVILVCTTVGAGVLSIPFAFNECGLILGLILLCFVWWMSWYALKLLYQSQMITKALSFEGVALHSLGTFGVALVQFCIFTVCFGILIAYTLALGELAYPAFEGMLGVSELSISRPLFILAVISAIPIPLAMLPHISKLKGSSTLAVVSVTFVTFVVVLRGIQKFLSGDLPDFHLARFDQGIFTAMPILSFALACSTQLIPVVNELQEKHLPRVGALVGSATGLCSFLYFLTGIFGYLQFGTETSDVILSNFEENDHLANVGRLLLSLKICLAYPLIVYPCRVTITRLITGRDNPPFSYLRHISITLTLCLSSYGLSLLIPKLSDIFGLIGALSATLLCYVLPAVFYLKLNAKIENENNKISKIGAWVIAVCGSVAGFISTVIILIGMIEG